MMENELPDFPRGDMGKAFAKFVDETYVRYRDCLIRKELNGWFSWAGKFYLTFDEVKDEIDTPLGLHINEPREGNYQQEIVMTIERDGKEVKVSRDITNHYYLGNSPYQLFRSQQ